MNEVAVRTERPYQEAVEVAYRIVEATQSLAIPEQSEAAKLRQQSNFYKQMLRVEQFPARRKAIEEASKHSLLEADETEFWERLGQKVTMPIRWNNTRDGHCFDMERAGLYVGGLEGAVCFKASFAHTKSLYIGPIPDEAISKYREASRCGHSQTVVVSTIKEHFRLEEQPIPKPPPAADPLLVAFTPVGQYLLHAWDWQEERFA